MGCCEGGLEAFLGRGNKLFQGSGASMEHMKGPRSGERGGEPGWAKKGSRPLVRGLGTLTQAYGALKILKGDGRTFTACTAGERKGFVFLKILICCSIENG